MSLQERARNTRSHSLKPLGQPSLLTQRSKRTLSLPAKPVIPPLINIQRYHDNWESNSDEDEPICDTPEEESMDLPRVTVSTTTRIALKRGSLKQDETSQFKKGQQQIEVWELLTRLKQAFKLS